ncbi:16707_t:CDS:2, partial [Acaulospora colombiana]
PAAYPPGYASPYQPQQQMPVYGQPQYVVPGQPMMYPQQQQVRERHKSREDNPPLDKFIDGAVYGPVFDLQTATILDIKIQLHPSLRHHLEQDDEPRLSWNILESVKEVHLMEVRGGVSAADSISEPDRGNSRKVLDDGARATGRNRLPADGLSDKVPLSWQVSQIDGSAVGRACEVVVGCQVAEWHQPISRHNATIRALALGALKPT